MRLTLGLTLKEYFPLSAFGSGGLLHDYQSRCWMISDHAAGHDVSVSELNANFVVHLVGTGATEVRLPADVSSPYGARIAVYNHNEVPVTIQGNRFTSVGQVGNATTSAPYFEVICDDANDDIFTNFIVLASI